MNVTKNFTLEELTKSATANLLKIDNVPNEQIKAELTKLCTELLQPIRDKYGKPIIVSSGYRSEALNKAVGGSKTSQHRFGQAADIKASDGNQRALWDVIKSMIDNGEIKQFGQLIWEKGNLASPQWIHISTGTKNQILYLR